MMEKEDEYFNDLAEKENEFNNLNNIYKTTTEEFNHKLMKKEK